MTTRMAAGVERCPKHRRKKHCVCLDGKAREMKLPSPFGNQRIFYIVEFWFCFDLSVIITWLSPIGIEGRQLVFFFFVRVHS